jgi:hypothetical protein
MRKVLASQDGSMLPIFLVFVLIVFFITSSAANLTAIALERQRLQSQADQAALADYRNAAFEPGHTTEVERCVDYELPLKLIGLPTTREICVRSAAR